MGDIEYDNHEDRLMSNLQQMMNSEQFADVIICCADGYKLRAHKVVLSYCSSYLQVRNQYIKQNCYNGLYTFNIPTL